MSSKRRYRRYYASLVLINMIIFNIVIIMFGMISFNALYRSESLKYLRKYDEVLSEITSIYNSKHENFYYMLFPLYNNITDMDYLNRFLNDTTDTLINGDPMMAKKMIAMLAAVGERDKDILTIYISKSATGSVFAYNCSTRAIARITTGIPYYDVLSMKNGRRMISGTQYIPGIMRTSIDNPRLKPAFGIAGTLENRASKNGQWSSILIAYQLENIDSKVRDPLLNDQARFGIITLDGQVIYDSRRQYAETGYTLLPEADLILAGSDTMTYGGATYLKNVSVDAGRGYASFYYIPKAVLNNELTNVSAPIIVIVIGFCAMSILIFFISVKLSGKRVSQLERGMKEIGLHNLGYRIPDMHQNDELSLVAGRFNEMCDQLQDTINKVYLYNIRQKEASFYALQTSINPHFLYNTLEAVRGKLSDDGNIDASEMIVMLSRLFEYQIKGETFVKINEEIDALELYVNFFELRYDYSFTFIADVQTAVLDYALPKYTLQPILENYFIHGIRQGDNNHIRLSASMEGSDVLIIIQDDGLGIDPEHLAAIRRKLVSGLNDKSSFGLINVHQRLRFTFDEPYGIAAIESGGEGQGTKVTIKIKAVQVDDLAGSNRMEEGIAMQCQDEHESR